MTALAIAKPQRTSPVDAWLERFRAAWEDGDAGDWIERAFTEDAVLRHHPLRAPASGHDEIRAHLRRAAAILGDAEIRIAGPVVDGDRASAEWWAQTTDGTHDVTMVGALFVRFAADGRVRELRRYGDMQPGAHEPHAGWSD
jgi:limonene-1,2-epoxide hydrolase